MIFLTTLKKLAPIFIAVIAMFAFAAAHQTGSALAQSDIWKPFENDEEEPEPLEPPSEEDILARDPIAIDVPSNLNLSISQVLTDEEHFPTVQLYVSALDAAGNPVKTIRPEHFSITEEGKPVGQPIFGDPLSRAPLAIVFVVDVSTSMELALGLEKEALKTFIDRLGEKDQAALISFSDVPVIEYYFTEDKERLKEAVDNLRLVGRTSLWDALVEGMNLALEMEGMRRAVVLMTDGVDNMSGNSPDSALEHYRVNAEEQNKTFSVFTLGLGLDIERVQLERVAKRTGGRFLESPTPGDLERVYREIITTIENEYVLEYTSPHTNDLGRMVTVRVDADYYGAKAAAEAIYRIPGLGGALARLMWPGIILTLVMTIVLIIVTYLKITRAAWLTVMITPLESKDYTISGGYAAIGRAEDNEIMLRQDPNVESHHAVISEGAGGFAIEALSSAHPIGIRNEWVRRVVLRDKDAFWIGNTMIIFREKALREGEAHPAEYPEPDLAPIDSLSETFAPADVPEYLEIISGPCMHAGAGGAAGAAIVGGAGGMDVAAGAGGMGKDVSGGGGTRFDVSQPGTYYVGRVEKAKLPGEDSEIDISIALIADARVSRLHAMLRRDGHGLWITDLGSTNGTYVDGVRIKTETPVTSGSIVEIGDTAMRGG